MVSEADLVPYVQDALNELQFIMDDASTEYGALRASLGVKWRFELNDVLALLTI